MSNNKFVEKNSRWNWMTTTAVAIIFFGVVALISNYTDFSFSFNLSGNWWAYILLIPAVSALAKAWTMSRSEGVTPRVIGILFGGLSVLLLVPIFVFNLNWATIWPVYIIVAGVGALFITLASSGKR